jgi:TolA-binding protein
VLALAGCAASRPRPVEPDELKELRAQLSAQSTLVADQQRRIEELEVRIAALSARAQAAQRGLPAQTPAAAPKQSEPRPMLKTIKLGEGRRVHRSDRPNPVERAPRLNSSLELKEPDESVLASLEGPAADPTIAEAADADHAWSVAVQKLNDGDHDAAEIDLLAFAERHPRHTAADNALYLAGLVREVKGDCAGALRLFDSVPARYPAGDAVPQALLEKGRCLRILGKKAEAKAALAQLGFEHPDAPEAGVARQLLDGL